MDEQTPKEAMVDEAQVDDFLATSSDEDGEGFIGEHIGIPS